MENNYETDLENEFEAVRGKYGQWSAATAEFAGVSAYLILNATDKGDAVYAFDSWDLAARIGDWFKRGTDRWWVWYACKSAIRKGRMRAQYDAERIGVKRLFVIDDSLIKDSGVCESASFGGVTHELSNHDKLLVVMWAQQMTDVEAKVIGKNAYSVLFKSDYERCGGYPDYAVVLKQQTRTPKKCVGWLPKGIWYPGQEWLGPGAGPVEHFLAVWDRDEALSVNDVLKLVLSQCSRLDQMLVSKERIWQAALEDLDREAFQAFQARWNSDLGNMLAKSTDANSNRP